MLAARLSALVDRWDNREYQMIDLLSKDGDVTVTDAAGKNNTVPSFPKLRTMVTELTDVLTGAVAQAQDINSQTVFYSNRALNSADSAASSAEKAANDLASIGDALAQAGTSAASAAASRDAAKLSEESASEAAKAATSAQSSAKTSEDSAKGYMDNAGFSAISTKGYRDDALLARDMSSAYSNAPVNAEVSPGQYSAFHWAEQARLIASGALIYKGAWDASGGSLPPTPKLGDFYFISKTGTVAGVRYASGDMAVYDGGAWDRIDNQQAVTSVAGRTGAITLTIADIAALQAALDAKANAAATQLTDKATITRLGDGDILSLRGPGAGYNFYMSGTSLALYDLNTGLFSWKWDGMAKALQVAGTITATSVNATLGFRSSGWAGVATDGVVFFGSGDSYIYKAGASYTFKCEQGGWSASLNSGGNIWTASNFNPASKLDARGSLGITGASVSNWNNATDPGWHMASAAPNAPNGSSGWLICFVTQHNGSWIQQEAWDFTLGPETTRWRRHCQNGSWSAWWQVRESSYRLFCTPNDPGGAAVDGDLWYW